jgi:hypothetical protein
MIAAATISLITRVALKRNHGTETSSASKSRPRFKNSLRM